MGDTVTEHHTSEAHTEAWQALTATDPGTRLPLFTPAGAWAMLANADQLGTFTAPAFGGNQVTVTSEAGRYDITRETS